MSITVYGPTSQLFTAVRYGAVGLAVFPCLNKPDDPKQHKRPLTTNGFYDASGDPQTILKWWTKFPDALIGIPTGKWFTVLDLDNKNGKNGLAIVSDWEQRSPLIGRTVHDGRHLFFQPDDTITCTTDEIALGVDTKGKGGYVIVPPSNGYSWHNGNTLLTFDLSQLPPWPDDLRLPVDSDEHVPADELVADEPELVALALAVIPNPDLGWDEWNRHGMMAWSASAGSEDGLQAFDGFSQKSKKYQPRETRERWKTYGRSPPKWIGFGTLYYLASKADPNWRTEYDERIIEKSGVKYLVAAMLRRQAERKKVVLRSYFAEELAQRPVEEVDWLVENFIPCGAVTGLFGDGGTGKDLLLLMLATAMTCEATWLSQNVKPGRVMYFPVEDDDKELRRRLEAIGNYYDIQYADFPGRLKITPLAGKDTVLAVSDPKSGLVKPTPLYFEIRKMIDDFKPTLVIVGNRVNIFAVNQNDDAQARQSMQLLSAIGVECGAAVIMPGHVSVAGMFSNTGTSGSVQWSNACRSRLFLSRVIDKEEKDEPDTDARLLEVRKANWGPTNKIIKMRWSAGVFVEDAGIIFQPDEVHAAAEFLRMLDLTTVEKVSLRRTANNYAPKVFSEDPRCALKKNRGKQQLETAMEQLILKGIVGTAEYGPPSHRHECLVRVQPSQKDPQK